MQGAENSYDLTSFAGSRSRTKRDEYPVPGAYSMESSMIKLKELFEIIAEPEPESQCRRGKIADWCKANFYRIAFKALLLMQVYNLGTCVAGQNYVNKAEKEVIACKEEITQLKSFYEEENSGNKKLQGIISDAQSENKKLSQAVEELNRKFSESYAYNAEIKKENEWLRSWTGSLAKQLLPDKKDRPCDSLAAENTIDLLKGIDLVVADYKARYVPRKTP